MSRRKGREGSFWGKRGFWLTLVPYGAALLFLITGIIRFEGNLSVSGDNAQFLILGQSLAAGKGMSHINQPEPTPHTKYPFFFPLILAGLHLVFPGSFLAPKIAVLLLGTVGIGIFAHLFLRTFPPAVAITAIILSAINPEMITFSSSILSEIPYLLLSAAALIFFTRWREEEGYGPLILAVLFAIAAYFTRTIGITLVFSLAGALVLRRHWKLACMVIVVFIAVATPWGMRNRALGGGAGYITQFLKANPYIPEGESLSIGQLFTQRVPTNLRKYGMREVGRGIVPVVNPGKAETLGLRESLSIVVSLLAVGGLLARARRRLGILEIYTLINIGICIIWPDVWASLRFLLPILPLLFLYLLDSGTSIFGKLLPKRRTAITIVLGILLAIPAVITNKDFYDIKGHYPANWYNYRKVAQWMREDTPEDSIVICRKPYLFYLWSGRRTESYLWSYDTQAVYRRIVDVGADYVVVFSFSATTPRYLLPMLEEYNDRFEFLRALKDPNTLVYRVKGPEEL